MRAIAYRVQVIRPLCLWCYRRLALAWHEHFPLHQAGRPCDEPSEIQLPEGVGARMEHRELWRWADEQVNTSDAPSIDPR